MFYLFGQALNKGIDHHTEMDGFFPQIHSD